MEPLLSGRADPAIARVTAEMEPQTTTAAPNEARWRSHGTAPPKAFQAVDPSEADVRILKVHISVGAEGLEPPTPSL
jgi:hypothetical protein